jgi:superfamily II DNA/RNA helicase
VLVATDCLSEGINLQEHFDAVVHYDLPWNPTRLEQREGRVDRYGQPRDHVRVTSPYYGSTTRSTDRPRRPPGDTDEVINALAENVLLRSDGPLEERLPGFDDYLRPATEQLHLAWDAAEERERRSRSIFAQETIRPEVAAELAAMQAAVGSGADVASSSPTLGRLWGWSAPPIPPPSTSEAPRAAA